MNQTVIVSSFASAGVVLLALATLVGVRRLRGSAYQPSYVKEESVRILGITINSQLHQPTPSRFSITRETTAEGEKHTLSVEGGPEIFTADGPVLRAIDALQAGNGRGLTGSGPVFAAAGRAAVSSGPAELKYCASCRGYRAVVPHTNTCSVCGSL